VVKTPLGVTSSCAISGWPASAILGQRDRPNDVLCGAARCGGGLDRRV